MDKVIDRPTSKKIFVVKNISSDKNDTVKSKKEKLTLEAIGQKRITDFGAYGFFGWMMSVAKHKPEIRAEIEAFANFESTFPDGAVVNNERTFE